MRYTVNGNSLKKFYYNEEEQNHDEDDENQTIIEPPHVTSTSDKKIEEILEISKHAPIQYLVKYVDNTTEWKDKQSIPEYLIRKFINKNRTIRTRSMNL